VPASRPYDHRITPVSPRDPSSTSWARIFCRRQLDGSSPMPTIDEVILTQSAVGGEDDVIEITIEYEIAFDDLDRLANVTYHETCRLIGDDTDIPGDAGNGRDDVLLPPSLLIDQTTDTGNQTLVKRTTGRRLTKKKANEDPSPLAPRDELRAEGRLVDLNNRLQPVIEVSKLLVDRF
jgi:hypothetical protein